MAVARALADHRNDTKVAVAIAAGVARATVWRANQSETVGREVERLLDHQRDTARGILALATRAVDKALRSECETCGRAGDAELALRAMAVAATVVEKGVDLAPDTLPPGALTAERSIRARADLARLRWYLADPTRLAVAERRLARTLGYMTDSPIVAPDPPS